MTLMCSGSWRSLRTQNGRDYLDLQVVHVVAPRAHLGPIGSIMAQPTCHSCIIHIVAPVAHWGHKILEIARCSWLLHTVAPGAHWGCRMSRNSQTGMWFMQWLLRLTGESEGLQGHRFTSGSNIGSYGSLLDPEHITWRDLYDVV